MRDETSERSAFALFCSRTAEHSAYSGILQVAENDRPCAARSCNACIRTRRT